MQDKEFDNLFKEKFADFQPTPSAALWGDIIISLDDARPRKRKAFWVPAAASIAAIFLTGLWFAKPNEEIKLKGQVFNAVPVLKQSGTGKKQTTVLSERLATLKINNPHEKLKIKELKKKLDISKASLANTVDQIDMTGAVGTQSFLATHTVIPVIEDLKIAVNNEPAPDVQTFAMLDENNIHDSKPRSSVNAIVDIFNYVVSKVDKRKDKIVEFSESDEGTLVSGINLGVLKYKSKQTPTK